MTKRVVVMGEGLLELSHAIGRGAALGFGGDTLNTSVYLARLGHAPHFVSALGCDPYSDHMLKEWGREDVQTAHVLRHPERMPGLYAIQTDHTGERSFYYWKDNSAARAFWELDGAEEGASFAAAADLFYLSGITLSLHGEAGIERYVEIAAAARARGGTVAFDPNYRPRGWTDSSACRQAVAKLAPHISVALPTLDDENLLHGDMRGVEHAARWLDAGTRRVCMKRGPQGACVYAGGSVHKVSNGKPVEPVDTTGAGDSFNAGFLAALLEGADDITACKAGNQLASTVVQYPGAIIPRSAMLTAES